MDAEIKKPPTRQDLQYLSDLPRDRQFQKILSWLFGTNSSRRDLAAAVVVRSHPESTRLLIWEAMAPRKSSERRVQLLQVIEQLGLPLEVGQWFDLQFAARRFDATVRAQVARVMARCRPGRSGPEPGGSGAETKTKMIIESDCTEP